MNENKNITIGVTKTESPVKQQYYSDWLKWGDPMIEVKVLSAGKSNAADLDRCDGLLLSGGVDIHPGFYGNEELNYENKPETFKPDRDRFEIAAYHSAIKRGMPVLGICRGLQLINCAEGGTLIQDQGERNDTHKNFETPDDLRHVVNVCEGTMLNEIVNAHTGEVNSAHHQSIDRLSEKLKVNCKAPDGTIEGLEWKDNNDRSFLLAVQWHPERMHQLGLQNAALSKNIRDRFINAIKEHIKSTI